MAFQSARVQVLLTGASGYVGQHMVHQLLLDLNRGLPLQITASYGDLPSFEEDCRKIDPSGSLELLSSERFNLADASSITTYFESRRKDNRAPFDIVIHLAALSSPLECEKNHDRAAAVNNPTALLDALVLDMQLYHQHNQHHTHKMSFIYMSTDQVYQGSKSFYDTDMDVPEPINFYGQSKLDMEHSLLQLLYSSKDTSFSFQPIILRSSLVVGPITFGRCRKQSFLQFIEGAIQSYINSKNNNDSETRTIQDNKKLEFFTNEYRNVIHVHNVIQVISFFIQDHIQSTTTLDHKKILAETPIYNMGGKDRVSRWDVLLAVAQYHGIPLDEVAHFAKPAQRINNAHSNNTPGQPITVQSPLDISMTMDKLKRCTNITFMGLEEIVASTFYCNTYK
jgi:dTDP-4-dehydrorhamnose reductase